jgi:transcriptional regulator with XRE-family HTH domain
MKGDKTMYREGRKQTGLSIEEAAWRLHIAPRTLIKYEAGETVPPPEVVLEMSREYHIPWLTQVYCREHCAIGAAYSYEVLNGINLDIQSVILSLRQEAEEAMAVLGDLEKLSRNKRCCEDFNDADWNEFVKALQEWLDLEHNIECIKISLGTWTDVSELVKQHNTKCEERGYVKKEKSAC